MLIKFNPFNTQIEDGLLRVCIDFLPEKGDKSYNPNDPNPILSHCMRVEDNIDQIKLGLLLNDVIPPNVVATIDDIMSAPLQAGHKISPLMKPRIFITKAKTKLGNADEVITKLNGFAMYGKTGKIFRVTPQSLDIGPGDNTGTTSWGTYTAVNQENPANITMPIDTFQVRANINIGTLYIGPWSKSGSTFYLTAYTTISNITTGAFRTFTGYSVACNAGDYLGVYCGSGNTCGTNRGYSLWMRGGNYFAAGTFTVQYTMATSYAIYGIGTGAGPAGVMQVDGISLADIGAIDGIAIADIKHIDGIG